MLTKKLAAVVAASVLTASSAAVAQTAQPLSLGNAPARAGAVMPQASSLDDRNGIGIYLIGAVGLKAPRLAGAFFICGAIRPRWQIRYCITMHPSAYDCA